MWQVHVRLAEHVAADEEQDADGMEPSDGRPGLVEWRDEDTKDSAD